MNTCDTCEHWATDGREFESGHRRCLNSKLESDAFYPDSLSPQDLHELTAVVTTGPKFGCVHHEPK